MPVKAIAAQSIATSTTNQNFFITAENTFCKSISISWFLSIVLLTFIILSPLFNNYRRALFVSINKDKTSAELATMLGVKEFAIRMLKNQVAVLIH